MRETRASRVTVALPRALLRYAKALAVTRGETFDRLVTRAVIAEVRSLTIEAWTKAARRATDRGSGA
jgi:hypothetical protein